MHAWGEHDVQWRIKSVRGDFYRRRKLAEITRRNVILTPDPGRALAEALAGAGSARLHVTVLPDGRGTLAKKSLYRYEPGRGA